MKKVLSGQDLGSLRENTDQTQLRLEKTQACLRIGGAVLGVLQKKGQSQFLGWGGGRKG